MTDCVFCGRIKSGEYESWSEHPSVVWFEPLDPVTPGHMLFVPVHHVTGADGAPNGPYETARTMEIAARWAQRNGVESFNLITSVGRPATQSVFHLHVHLVPRVEDDAFALPWTGQKDRQEMERMIEDRWAYKVATAHYADVLDARTEIERLRRLLKGAGIEP